MTRSSNVPNRSRSNQSPLPPTFVEGLEQRQLLSAAVVAVIDSSPLHAKVSSAVVDIANITPMADAAGDTGTSETSSEGVTGVSPTNTVVTSSASGNTSIYGTAVTFTATVAGTAPIGTVTFFDGETSLGAGTAGLNGTWTLSTSALHAGSHNITAVYSGDDVNAGSTSSIRTAAVTAKAITVSGITASNKTYDGTTTATPNATAATLVGVETGDAANVTLLGKATAAGTFANANAGTSKTITVTGLTLSGSAAADYTLTQPTTTADITAKALTVTGITAAGKTYDNSTTATLTTTSAALSGVVTADSANVTLVKTDAAGAFANANAANGKTVTVSGLTLSGSAAANYTLTQPTTTANIAARAITITGVTAANKTYDGTTNAVLDFSGALVSGIFATDDANLSIVTTNAVGTFADKNVGTAKSVTITGVTLSGTAAANYTVTQPSATANIIAKAITITGVSASNKAYDGTNAATISTGSAALSGVLTADKSAVTLVKTSPTGTFANANVGTGKTITISGLTLSGTGAANYTLTQPTATANITPKAVTITGITADNKAYDGTNTATVHTGSATLSGVLTNDASNVTISGGTGTFSTVNVGTGLKVTTAVTLGGSAGANYTVTPATTTANITPRALTVNDVTATKVYNGTTSGAKVSVTGATLTGILTSDAGKVTLVKPNITTGVFSSANAGTNLVTTITGLKLSGAAAKNYTLTAPSITATITAKAITVTGVTGINKAYDGTTDGTVTTTRAALSGLVAADKANVTLVTSGAEGTFSTADVGNKVSMAASGLTLSGSAAGNYTLTQPTTTANITPKALTITGVTVANKVYDGTTAATLVTGSAALSGVVTGDVGDVTLTTALATATFANKNVGTALPVTIKGMIISGTAAKNYTLTQPTATANITPKAITVTGVTADDKAYSGDTTAHLNTTGLTLSGFLTADKNIKLVTTGATGTFSSKDVGTGRTVTTTGLTLSGTGSTNYIVTQPTTTADITAKALTVTGITADKEYDGTTIATLDSSDAVLSGVATADLTDVELDDSGATAGAFTGADAGDYSITVSGLTLTGSAAANYTVTEPTIDATIMPKEVTVTGITAANKAYNGSTSAVIDTTGATLNGILIADASDVTLVTEDAAGTFADKNAGTGKTVTIGGLSFTGDAAGNYTLAPTTATATITPKAITLTGITADDKAYDGTDTATLNTGGAIVSGVLATDLPNVTIDAADGTFASADAGADQTVTIDVTLGGSAAANYTVTPPTTTASITPLALTVSGIDADKVYDGTTDATLDFSDAVLAGVATDDLANVSLTGTDGTFASSNVGTGLTVTPTNLALSGSAAGNYTLTLPTITAAITPLGITASGITANKAYDGTTAATLNLGGATLGGVLTDDLANVTLTGTTGTFAAANADTGVTVTPTNLALTGSAASNYTLTPPTITGAITPLAITASGITADKVYDGTTDATLNLSGATLGGVLTADLANVTLSGTAGTFADANVGTDIAVTPTTLELTGSAAGNYTLTPPTVTADITPLALTASGITANKTYDGTTAATLNLGGATLTGVVTSDLANVTLTGTAGTFASANAGSGLAVTPTNLALTGSAATNYTLTPPTVSAAIATKELTVTGIIAENKLFDGTTAAALDTSGATLVGVVTGDIANATLDTSGAIGTFSQSDPAPNLTVTVSGLTLTGSAAGNYALTQPTTTASIIP